ncbi:MAG: DUF4124 domain-containing protein [Gallionella sp.]|nr:DUF4124 domain-containing protein [Gallionella sp.]
MKRYLPLLLLLFSAASFAALNKWVDENGKVHYSDQPAPASAKSQKTLRATVTTDTAETPASAPGTPKTIAEREADLKKTQQAKKEAADKAAQEQTKKETEQANCATARQNLLTLQSGVRIVETGNSGERSYLDEAQRQQRVDQAQKNVDEWCK